MTDKHVIPLRLLLLFLVLWGLWTLRLGAKFYGEQDSFRTWIPAAVRNYDLYDYDDIGFMIVRDNYLKDLDDLYRYSHHPPLLAWLPALVVKGAGHNEVAIRFIFPAVMMIAVAALYTFARSLYDMRMAFWTALFFGITPFIAYFQTSYGPDPLGFMALLLFAAVFVKWLQQPNSWLFISLMGWAVLAVWSAWPAVIFIGVIGIIGMFLSTWRQRTGIIILGAVAVVALAIMLALYEMWWDGAFESLMDAYVWRSSSASFRPDSASFTMSQWISRNLSHTLFFGTLGLFMLAIIGAYFLKGKGRRNANVITLSLLLAALVYFLMFRNATYVHTYYKAYLMPVFAIAGASAVVYGRAARRSRILKPVIDALVLACVIQSIYMLDMLVDTTDEPSVTTVIDFIDMQEEDPERIVVAFVDVNPGTRNAIEYYTMQSIEWNRPLADISWDEEVILYIFCNEDQDYVIQYFGRNPPENVRLDATCTAYWLRA